MKKIWNNITIAVLVYACFLSLSCAHKHSNSKEVKKTKASVSLRSQRRLYAYAPPIIPHKIAKKPCLSCHISGNKQIPAVPHAKFEYCRECHVIQEKVKLSHKNTFVGLKEPEKLPKEDEGAPPSTPHRTFMREECLACHGENSRSDVINSPHPKRTNCQQCHLRVVTK